MHSKILIELVPKTCWFSNVRSQVSQSDWDILRKEAYKKYNHQCSVCQRKGRMEAHEIWHYDDINNIQKLYEITSVCNSCHMLYHIGFSSVNGKFSQSLRWLSKLNNWDTETSKLYIDIIFEIWHQRSRKKWHLDLSLLDNKNIKYKIINIEDRVDFSKKELKR